MPHRWNQHHSTAVPHSNGGVPLITRSFPRATLRVCVCVSGLVPSIPWALAGIWEESQHTSTHPHIPPTFALQHHTHSTSLTHSPTHPQTALSPRLPRRARRTHCLCLSVGNSHYHRPRRLRGSYPAASQPASLQRPRTKPPAPWSSIRLPTQPISTVFHQLRSPSIPPALSTGATGDD